MERGLVPGRDVGQRPVVKPLETAQHLEIDPGKVVAFGVGQCRDVGNLPVRHQQYVHRPSRGLLELLGEKVSGE